MQLSPTHLCLHTQLAARQAINCCGLLQRHHVTQQHVEAVGGEGGIVGAHHPLQVAARAWTGRSVGQVTFVRKP